MERLRTVDEVKEVKMVAIAVPSSLPVSMGDRRKVMYVCRMTVVIKYN